MPRFGGGANGGGFGGGSRGGGFGGGGGGFGGGHRGPRYGGFGFYPGFGFGPRFYGGGGCLGGLLGMLLAPLILLLVVVLILVGTIGTTISNVANGGTISYNEQVFQDYTLDQYEAEFGTSKQYESNLLIVLLTNEETDGYYAIGLSGYYVQDPVADLFGNERSAFGRVVRNSINTENYRNTLSGDLMSMVSRLTREVEAVQTGDTALKTGKTSDTSISSHVTDYTGLVRDKAYVDEALAEFTAATDVPVVIVVEDMETVFGKTLPLSTIFTFILLIVVAVIAVVWIVKTVKKNKNKGGNGNSGNGRFDGNPNTGNGNGGSYNRNGGGGYDRG